MREKQELRVFYTQKEMLTDYTQYCEEQADQYHTRDTTARKGDWRIRWISCDRCKDTTSMIAGMCFNRIRCDIRVDKDTQMYIMSRLRSSFGEVEPMMVFLKKVFG